MIHKKLSAIMATTLGATVTLVGGGVPQASAFQTCSFNRLTGNTVQGLVNVNIGDAYENAAQNSFWSWSNRAGSFLSFSPVSLNQSFNSAPGGTAGMMMGDLDAIGLPYPGYTFNSTYPPNASHATSTVWMNSTWKWFTDGTFNESAKYADFRTVGTHEVGHVIGLAHPFACHAMTAEESVSVMNPNFTAKWYLTSDDLNAVAYLY